MHILEPPEVLRRLGARRPACHQSYYAMYSSLLGGVVTDPALMVVPVDDHMVHRGDGVFETFKCVNGALYNLQAHLDRLKTSACALGFRHAFTPEVIESLVVETVRMAGRPNCAIRLLLSRGPGSFDVNPYDCEGPHLYIIVTTLKPPFMQTHPQGAVVRSSRVVAKPPFYAGIKHCNYVPNVLMKKEAVDCSVDFVVGFDTEGFMTEGATENFGIVTDQGKLCFPRLDGILCGTTMVRVAELAETAVKEGLITGIGFQPVSREAMLQAREILIVGTTPNVIAVREWDGRPVGNGHPGPVYRRLQDLLVQDIAENPERLTRVMEPEKTN